MTRDRVRLLREVSLSLLAGSNHGTGGFTKETLELRVRLHDLGAIEVLEVLGVLVRAHALCVLSFRGISLAVPARAVLDRTTCKLQYECIHVY